LAGNLLDKLPDNAFDRLKNLQVLDLSNNPNLVLSSKLFGENMANLQDLWLNSCKISSLPDELFKNLTCVFPNFSTVFNNTYCRGLKKLHLSNNPLTSIPSQLKLAPNVEYLALSGTLLSEIRPDSFIATPKLMALYLYDMKKLELVDNCAFCGLSELNVSPTLLNSLVVFY
jgi:Leucine-rich repeat (LRR) protein